MSYLQVLKIHEIIQEHKCIFIMLHCPSVSHKGIHHLFDELAFTLTFPPHLNNSLHSKSREDAKMCPYTIH